jgi:hypothetical protein
MKFPRNFKHKSSSEKYFLWEFELNEKYHKIELCHSPICALGSERKPENIKNYKLKLDDETIQEHKGYSSDSTYSFKVDKNYFHVVQIDYEKFELLIDNRTFDTLMQEEISNSFNSEKKEEEVGIIKEVVSKKSFEPTIQKQFSMAFPSSNYVCFIINNFV